MSTATQSSRHHRPVLTLAGHVSMSGGEPMRFGPGFQIVRWNWDSPKMTVGVGNDKQLCFNYSDPANDIKEICLTLSLGALKLKFDAFYDSTEALPFIYKIYFMLLLNLFSIWIFWFI